MAGLLLCATEQIASGYCKSLGLVDILVYRLQAELPVGVKMAEIRLVSFAWIARQVAEDTPLRYHSKHSQHTFSQPNLLPILGVIRKLDRQLSFVDEPDCRLAPIDSQPGMTRNRTATLARCPVCTAPGLIMIRLLPPGHEAAST
jgi:hypothetical protein